MIQKICNHSSTNLQVFTQESLKEAALSTALCAQDVAAEDAALSLLLLQINALITSDWNIQTEMNRNRNQ